MLNTEDLKLIDSLVKIKDTYERLTSNTNELFRKELSEELAKRMPSYKFQDFVAFLSDAETIQRLSM